MKRKIIVSGKEYTMPKMSVEAYEEYLEIMQHVQGEGMYSKEDIEMMALGVCKAYGWQFTVEELRDPETGLDAAGLIVEFLMIDAGVSDQINKKIEEIQKNFQNGK